MHLRGLAPDGVCLAAHVTMNAGALLPHRFTLTSCDAISSLWHYAGSFHCLTVSQHHALWSADFPQLRHA